MKKQEILLATTNIGKLNEIRAVLSDSFELLSLADLNIDIQILEDGDTFEENAVKKALGIMHKTDKITLADDSGLEIDFFEKLTNKKFSGAQPSTGEFLGVDSANFMGVTTPYDVRCAHILDIMRDVPENLRTARFVCVLALAIPANSQVILAKGSLEGLIATEISENGKHGFGYDPIFYVPEIGKTLGELAIHEKNSISHRAKALAVMAEKMKILL
ncbi:MAG: non-canonical purine NTP pyrophosphatase [Defluviitaleaceae bacterium]|nr:non-canonical purine NTP pyrophosphatase [Defluviitaleaceae bacterium]